MQSLSQSQSGTYTIKWMIGLSDISEQLANYHIAEGNTIQVLHKVPDGIIIGYGNRRFALGNEVADRIKV